MQARMRAPRHSKQREHDLAAAASLARVRLTSSEMDRESSCTYAFIRACIISQSSCTSTLSWNPSTHHQCIDASNSAWGTATAHEAVQQHMSECVGIDGEGRSTTALAAPSMPLSCTSCISCTSCRVLHPNISPPNSAESRIRACTPALVSCAIMMQCSASACNHAVQSCSAVHRRVTRASRLQHRRAGKRASM